MGFELVETQNPDVNGKKENLPEQKVSGGGENFPNEREENRITEQKSPGTVSRVE